MQVMARTGAVALGEVGGDLPSIGSGLTRTAFLGTAPGRASTPVVDNDPYRSYSLRPIEAHGTVFLLRLCFEDERLASVEIMDGDPRFGSTHVDRSEAKERARDARHREWLAGWGLGPGEQPWGRVLAGYDGQAEESVVWLVYESASAED